MKKNKKGWFVALSSILFIMAIVFLLCFFMYGRTTTKSFSTKEKATTLVCETSDADYPFLDYDESTNKHIKINAIFGGDRLSTISLVLLLYYKDDSSVKDSKNLNIIAMNDSFANAGLGFNDLGLKFSEFADRLQMSLFTSSEKLNRNIMKYFLLDDIDDTTINEIQTALEKKKFECQ